MQLTSTQETIDGPAQNNKSESYLYGLIELSQRQNTRVDEMNEAQAASASTNGDTSKEPGKNGAKSGNRISRLLKRRSQPANSTESAPSEECTSSQKRRQQVYQAQKRHRNQQVEYVANLEAEIAQLQHLDSVARAEMTALAHENKAMRDLLASKSIDTQLEAVSLTATPIAAEDMSQLGSAALDIRFDPVVGHERTFVDVSDKLTFAPSGSTNANAGEVNNWAALDFILSLEHCCQDHTFHVGVNSSAYSCSIDGGSHGHALSTTLAVYQSATPPPNGTDADDAKLYGAIRSSSASDTSQRKWQLPHSEIDKLVAMSEQLPLDDNEMTPAHAYSAIQKSVPDVAYVKPVMEALKVLLAPHMACFGFGAVMPAVIFWEHLDTVLQTLGLETQPESS